MEEKIKIYVTGEVEAILEKDAESFEFYKPSGKLNRNALLTRLIVNYSEEFYENKNNIIDYITERLAKEGFKTTNSNRMVIGEISEQIQKMTSLLPVGKFDKAISIKPTKKSAPIISYIENYCLGGVSLSEYFRNMFSSYAVLSQDKREKIIFKQEYEALLRVIKNKKQVYLTLRNTGQGEMAVMPYAICNSKEEMHLYLISSNLAGTGASPVRLSRITSVRELEKPSVIGKDVQALLDKMIKYGPQFIYRTDEGEAVIELTDKGVSLFKKMYVHRPVPDKIEGNLYYFSCSHSQLRQYFVRFGEEAFVVSPTKLRYDIFHFHKRAQKHIDKLSHRTSGEH